MILRTCFSLGVLASWRELVSADSAVVRSGLRTGVLTMLLAVCFANAPRAGAEDKSAVPSPAQAQLIPSAAPGWPQWRGPRRDGICDEVGLLQEWPAEGPRLVWQTNGLGRGYSAPVIVGDRLFLAGDVGEELRLFALDLTGRQLWQGSNGRSWTGPYPGARASATWHEGRLFHLNAHGRVAAFEAETGRELWAIDLFERYGGKNLTWALSECLLVDGSRVLATAGGTDALMVALDARSGETVWKTEPLRLGPSSDPQHQRVEKPAGQVDNASYASPILVRSGDRRQVIGCSTRHLFGVDADRGTLLWTRPLRTQVEVIATTPVLVGDAVFVTAPDSPDAKLYRLGAEASGRGLELLWTTALDTCQGGVVHVGDALYGAWYRRRKGWACIDARTGVVRYETSALAKGAVLYADQRLYCLSEQGEMALIKPTPEGFEFTGRFTLVPGRQNDVWTHPVIFRGRLYLRHHETLFCFDVNARGDREPVSEGRTRSRASVSP